MEPLVEVPTEPVFVEQTVDIPVLGGGGRRHLQGVRAGQGSAACAGGGLRGFPPGQGFNSVILRFSLSNCCAQRRGLAF